MRNTFKYILTASAVALLLAAAASCTDGSYYGFNDDELADLIMGVSSRGPEPVKVLVGDYGRKVTTKGNGAETDRFSWSERNPEIYVYAFRKDSACYTSTASDGTGQCLLDGNVDSVSVRAGRKATFSAPEYALEWPKAKGGDVEYPDGKIPYDFFAYSTGGLAVKDDIIDRKAATISFPLKIDGCSDVMYAKAALTESQLSCVPYLDLTSEDEENFQNLCFSDYSARKGIVPTLPFHHALTRISFDMYPGEEGCNKVCIHGITVQSKDSCILTVASSDSLYAKLGADFSIDGKDALISLREADGSTLNDTLYHTDYHGDFTEDILLRPHMRVGGSFLIPQEDEYVFTFYTKVKGYTTTIATYFTVRPAKGGPFLAGSHYVLRVSMHDLTPVLFDADVDPWEDGGEL